MKLKLKFNKFHQKFFRGDVCEVRHRLYIENTNNRLNRFGITSFSIITHHDWDIFERFIFNNKPITNRRVCSFFTINKNCSFPRICCNKTYGYKLLNRVEDVWNKLKEQCDYEAVERLKEFIKYGWVL